MSGKEELRAMRKRALIIKDNKIGEREKRDAGEQQTIDQINMLKFKFLLESGKQKKNLKPQKLPKTKGFILKEKKKTEKIIALHCSKRIFEGEYLLDIFRCRKGIFLTVEISGCKDFAIKRDTFSVFFAVRRLKKS
jgi:hypothetical protein